MKKASTLRRLGAAIIDGIVMLCLFVLLVIVPLALYANGKTFDVLGLALLLIGGVLVLYGYPTILVWKYGATLGKKLFGITVVNTNGRRVSFQQILLRESVGKAIASLLYYLGFLWIIWDKDKQGWHDKIFHTYVVESEKISLRRTVQILFSIGFVLYFLFMTCVSILLLPDYIKQQKYYEIFNLIVSFPSLVAMGLFILHKRVGTEIFWKMYTLLFLPYDIIHNVVILPILTKEPLDIYSFLGLALVAPIYITLYLYSFHRSKKRYSK